MDQAFQIMIHGGPRLSAIGGRAIRTHKFHARANTRDVPGQLMAINNALNPSRQLCGKIGHMGIGRRRHHLAQHRCHRADGQRIGRQGGANA